jgi:hypothetical protein
MAETLQEIRNRRSEKRREAHTTYADAVKAARDACAEAIQKAVVHRNEMSDRADLEYNAGVERLRAKIR